MKLRRRYLIVPLLALLGILLALILLRSHREAGFEAVTAAEINGKLDVWKINEKKELVHKTR